MKTQKDRDVENEIILLQGILCAIENAVSGQEPDDFMLSFPVVRKVWELQNHANNQKPQKHMGDE